MDEGEYFVGGLGSGFVLCLIMMLALIHAGDFNNTTTEPLAQEVCQSRYGTHALSYEQGILTCFKTAQIDQEDYVIDFKKEKEVEEDEVKSPHSYYKDYIEGIEEERTNLTKKCREVVKEDFDFEDPWCVADVYRNACHCKEVSDCVEWGETEQTKVCTRQEMRIEEFILK